jgi:Holliday junction resolvasome RuvABC endonuclease subunit
MLDLKNIVIQGQDVSLNHAAMVELTGGEMTDFRYITDQAGDANYSPHGTRINVDAMKKVTGKDKQRWSLMRVSEMAGHVRSWGERRPHYIGLEDYAVGKDQGAHYIGEIGGFSRMLAWELGIPLRLHDPTTMKMFVAHDGTASKDDVEYAVAERWGVEFSEFSTGKKSRQTTEDLADAYGMAKMVWYELLLRRGIMPLRDFHEKEIRMFHRVTKAQPVCLLEREWTQRTDVKSNHDTKGNNKRQSRRGGR